MPRPNPEESKNEFISRCMDDDEMKRRFPDRKKRSGRCYGYWESYGEE